MQRYSADPAVGGFAITTSDSTDLPARTRGLIVTAAGDVKVTFYDGTTVTLPALVAGVIHPVCVRRVWSTSTTATGIVGVY